MAVWAIVLPFEGSNQFLEISGDGKLAMQIFHHR
jgi:hypothetical protein